MVKKVAPLWTLNEETDVEAKDSIDPGEKAPKEIKGESPVKVSKVASKPVPKFSRDMAQRAYVSFKPDVAITKSELAAAEVVVSIASSSGNDDILSKMPGKKMNKKV